MIIAIFLVVLIFGILVFVHELGHFTAAKRSGVAVEEFGFGFPPRAWGKKVGKTIYSVNWLPLGGFVRLKGEDGTDMSKGSFNAASYAKKMFIIIAGVFMNVIMAYVVLVFLGVTGMPASVAKSLSSATPAGEQPVNVLVLAVSADSPASRAGIAKGESIISVNGNKLSSEQELVDTTKELAGQRVSLVVSKGGNQRTVVVPLRSAEEGKNKGYLGVSPFETHNVTYGLRSLWVAAEMTANMMWQTLKGFALGIVSLLHVGGKPGGSGEATVTGPVGIVVLLNSVLQLGSAYVLFFVATISASLAVVNILPIPALDGGRAFLLTVKRLTGKSLTPEREALVHTIGFVALIGLMLLITVFDVRRLFG